MGIDQSEEVAVSDSRGADASPKAPGDADGFAAWVSPHLRALAALAARQVGRANAEDVVQETLLRAWRRRETFRPDRGSVKAWLVAILLDRARRYRLRTRHPDPFAAQRDGATQPATAPPDESVADDVDLTRAVARLPRRQREVVTLHYLSDVSVNEIAIILGISVGSVKSHLHDARHALRRQLEMP